MKDDQASDRFVDAPEPPYYIALATTQVSGPPEHAARYMAEIYRQAALTPGFLGAEKAREASGFGLAAFFFETEEAHGAWIAGMSRAAEEMGLSHAGPEPFARCVTRLARVERAADCASQAATASRKR